MKTKAIMERAKLMIIIRVRQVKARRKMICVKVIKGRELAPGL